MKKNVTSYTYTHYLYSFISMPKTLDNLRTYIVREIYLIIKGTLKEVFYKFGMNIKTYWQT